MAYRQVVTVFSVFAVVACSQATYRLEPTGAGQGLSRITSDKDEELGPQISPDGRNLLFDTRFSKSAAVIGVDPNTGARRTMYTPPTSRAQEAAWDPTGRFFVYTSNSTGSWSLVRSLSNSPNAAIAVVVNGDMAPLISDPDVSPDGRRVAFATQIREAWNIAISNIDGSNFTIMGEGVDPSWSPDGNRIAFVRIASERAHIFTQDVNTGGEVIQVTSGESDNIDPSWSPDGSYLVFSSNRTNRKAPRGFDFKKREKRGQFNLFAVRPDGTGLVQLTDGNALTVQPRWGTDNWVYFASNQAGNFDIWRLRPSVMPSAEGIQLIAVDAASQNRPDLTADTKYLVTSEMNVPLYETPDTSSRVMYRLQKNFTLTLVEDRGEWLLVQVGAQKAYIQRKFVSVK